MQSRLAFVSPEVFAVDNGHRNSIEIDIVEQARVDADLGVSKSGLPVDQSGDSE